MHTLTHTLGSLSVALLLAATASGQGTNHSLRFDGSTGYGSAPGVGGLVSNSTWEAWVRVSPNSTRAQGTVVQRWGMWSHALGVNIAEGRTGVSMYSCHHSCPNAETPANTILPGTWYHIALVYGPEAGPSCVCYVNGQPLAQCGPLSCSPYAGWETVLAADGYIGYQNFFDGDIDEVRISNVQRYTAAFTPALRHTPDANTVGLWHFDEGAGNTALDASGNGMHFNLHGGYQWVAGNFAIAATFQTFGTGCPGSAGVPSLQNQNGSLPRAGSDLWLRLSNLPNVATVCVPFFGLSNQSFQGMQLPMGLATYGMPGCSIFTDVHSTTFLVGTLGSASWQVPIPSMPSMVGTRFFLQSLVFDPLAGNPARTVVTNAADARIGG